MGYDLVTWSPCIGGGGDNSYNVSGARKLDGSQDAGAQTRITAGDTSGFSSTPTIPQLNVSSGFNQVVGAYNRRVLTLQSFASGYWSTIPTVASYLAAGATPKASDFTSLLTKINTLRSAEFWTGGALTWPIDTPTSGKTIRGDYLAYLRKALAISGTIVQPLGFGGGSGTSFASATPNLATQYNRYDNPYNTGTSEDDGASPGFNRYCGKLCPSSSQMQRFRSMPMLQCCEWFSNGITSASMTLNVSVLTNSLEAMNLRMYGSATYPPVLTPTYGGTAYATTYTLLSSATITTTGSQTFTLATSPLVSNAGGVLTTILGQVNELASSGAGITSGQHSYIQLTTTNSDHYLTLTF